MQNFDFTHFSIPCKQKHWNNINFPLTLDSAGNLYGVTDIGGAYGWGFVFKLASTSKGPWTLTTLYSFNVAPAPYSPFSGLIFDSAGNLYGTTSLGGTEGVGTVYELSPSSGGAWTERDIVDFPASCSPVCKPESGVILDSAGNLFGTTPYSGAYNFGSAYEVSPNGDGTWTLTGLHDFGSGTDGLYPGSGVLLDVSGKLYGTTIEGGTARSGTVFQITP